MATTLTRRRSTAREFRLLAACLIASMLALGSIAAAATISGKVSNLSRNQPSVGDDVVLYRVDSSMHEVGRTKCDAHGAFRFEAFGGSHYLVAVTHEKVSYHSKVLNAGDPVDVSVYDVAPNLAGVQEVSETIFPRAEDRLLRVEQFFVVENQSNPPRTLSTQPAFSFQLPRGAVLDSTAVQPPGTLPFLTTAPACGEDRYCLSYPMRPGITKIRAAYHLPYVGSISITPSLPHAVNELALMVPDSLHFEAATPGRFVDRGRQDDLSVYVANGIPSGAPITFSLSHASRLSDAQAATTPTNNVGLPGTMAAKPAIVLVRSGRAIPLWAILLGVLSAGVLLSGFAFRWAVRLSG